MFFYKRLQGRHKMQCTAGLVRKDGFEGAERQRIRRLYPIGHLPQISTPPTSYGAGAWNLGDNSAMQFFLVKQKEQIANMESLHEMMQDYKKQLQKGDIQKAYLGLMEYMMGLRTYLKKKYPDSFVSGFYQGYMDMSYFSFTPQSLKLRDLKIAIVFIFETFRFEVWLGAKNKEIQAKYWDFFKESGWDQFRLLSTIEGEDSILEHVLVDGPDFRDLDVLTKDIESGTLKFIHDVEDFLSAH